MHPRGRTKNPLVRQHLLTAAHQGAVASRHDLLLAAQDNAAAVRSSRYEERNKLVASLFDMRTPVISRADRFIIERLGDVRAGAMQQTSRRLGQGEFTRRPVSAGAFDDLDLAQVGVARGRRVVRLEEAKKG